MISFWNKTVFIFFNGKDASLTKLEGGKYAGGNRPPCMLNFENIVIFLKIDQITVVF